MALSVLIRHAHESDAEAINAIYNPYVLSSTCTFQMTVSTLEERQAWLRRHGTKHPVLVAMDGERMVAWGALTPYHPREAFAATVENSVYVHHDFHRQGLGQRLLIALIDHARHLGHHSIVALICSEQEASLALHHRYGFTDAGCLRAVGRKFDRWLDLSILQLSVT